MADTIISAEVDTKGLNDALAGIRDALIGEGKDVKSLLKDECIRLTRMIMDFTPPTMPGGGSKGDVRAVGELAVKKDLNGLISEAEPHLIDTIGSKFGLRDVDTFIETKTGQRLHLIWSNLTVDPARMEAMTHLYRDSRGRIKRTKKASLDEWRSRIVVSKGMREAFINKSISHLGRWKATWAYGAYQLGSRLKPWITRHIGWAASRAHYGQDLDSKINPFVIIGGRGPNFRRDIQRIQEAVHIRAKTIRKRIEKSISGYAEDHARRQRAKAGRKTSDEAMPEGD